MSTGGSDASQRTTSPRRTLGRLRYLDTFIMLLLFLDIISHVEDGQTLDFHFINAMLLVKETPNPKAPFRILDKSNGAASSFRSTAMMRLKPVPIHSDGSYDAVICQETLFKENSRFIPFIWPFFSNFIGHGDGIEPPYSLTICS